MILVLLLFSLCAEPWELHYTQGRLLAQRADWKQAEAEFRLVVQDRPGFLPGRLGLGTVLQQAGDWDGAEAQFRAALLLEPNSIYALSQLAQTLMKLRRNAAAIVYWRQAIALEPENFTHAIGLSAALFDAGSLAEAQKTLSDLAAAHPDSAMAQFSLGNLYARRGMFAEAVEAYRACLKTGSVNDDARLALVKALLALDRHQEALDALRGRPEDFDTLLLRGTALRGMGEDVRAAADLTEAVRLAPADYNARYNLGFVFSRMNRDREAKEQLERAAELRPDAAEAQYRLALVLKNLNESGGAEKLLREFELKKRQGLQQTISATSLNSANELLSAGKARDAVKRYQEAIRLDPNNASAFYNLALAYAKMGELTEQETSLRKAVSLDPKLALARNQLGVLLLAKGKPDDAEREFQASLAANSQCAECQNNLGVLYGQKGKAWRAEELFRSAIEADPGYGEARVNLGLLLAASGRYEEAEKQLQIAPADAKALTALGMVQTKLAKPEAVRTLQRVVALHPDSADARINLGIALADNQKLEDALAQFTEACRLNPRDASAHYNRGRVFKDLGALQEAAKELEAADALPDALLLHAQVEQQLENGGRAIQLFRRAATANPENARAWFLLGQSLKQAGRDAEAVEAWKRSLVIDPDHTESLYALFRALSQSHPQEANIYGARLSELKKQTQAVSRAETLSNFAIASAAKKEWDKAFGQMREAIDICGDCISKAGLHKNLGLLQCQAGDVRNGEQELRIALKDKPDDPDILKALKIIGDLAWAPVH